jgi:hypothetical protein
MTARCIRCDESHDEGWRRCGKAATPPPRPPHPRAGGGSGLRSVGSGSQKALAALERPACSEFNEGGRLTDDHFDALITDVRLGADNELDLIARAGPWMTKIAMSAFLDPVIRRDAAQAGARLIAKPTDCASISALLRQTAPRAKPRAIEREPILKLMPLTRARLANGRYGWHSSKGPAAFPRLCY